MQSLIADLLDSIAAMPAEFATVIGADPVGALLFLVGNLLFATIFGAAGYLAGGAAVQFATSLTS